MTNTNEQLEAERLAIVSDIETILSRAFPTKLQGERIEIREEIKQWSTEFARKRNLKPNFVEKEEPVRRTIVTIGKRYIIAVHDPMGPPRGLSAESITGADYAVEFPINSAEDKFLLVQLKEKSYGMHPKQYFGMGAAYMFMQYIGWEWTWFNRLRTGAEYVTKRKRPHNEFLFVKIIGDEIYVPLSSVLRTFESSSYKLDVNLTSSQPKSGEAKYEQTAKYVEFADIKQHLSEYLVGLTEFMGAATKCSIGLVHERKPGRIRSKANFLFFLSELSSRPNVMLIETKETTFNELMGLL